MSKPEAKCLYPGCENPQHARGQCSSCYKASRVAIDGGRVTWDDLIADGVATGHSSRRSAARRYLDARKTEAERAQEESPAPE
jgi:hypothetical protein